MIGTTNNLRIMTFVFSPYQLLWLKVSVSINWARMGSVWEEEKPEARKIWACTVPQAQVKMATNPKHQVHAVRDALFGR